MKAVKIMGNYRVEVKRCRMPCYRERYGDYQGHGVRALCGSEPERLLSSEKPLPVTPGHEVAGEIVGIKNDGGLRAGDRVVVDCHMTCGECGHCKNGDLIFCEKLLCYGFDLDGGDAEYMAVKESSLRPLPDAISDEMGCLIVDTLGTPYHAVKKANIAAGDIVAVFGVGPIGLLAALTC